MQVKCVIAYLPKSPPNPPILGEPESSPPKVGELGTPFGD
jgi:hypothetical protein